MPARLPTLAHGSRGPVLLDEASPTRAAAEELVGALYAAAGLAAPRTMVWTSGPCEQARIWAGRLRPSGRNVAREIIRDPVDRAAETLASATLAQHLTRAWAPRSLERTIAETAAESAGEPWHRSFVRSRRLRNYLSAGFGPLAAGEISAASTALAEKGHDKLATHCDVLARVLRSVGWIIPHERTCWLAEPCSALHTDPLGRPHSATEPAVEFADGWRIHAWKGVVVPNWIVETPARITAAIVDFPYDAWVRRCMIDILTPQRFIAEGGAICFSSDATGRLWRRRWWNSRDNTSDAWAAIEVVNGTPEPDGSHKHYYLQVPPEVQTPREAVAWTYGMSEAQYTALVQRT